MNHVFARSGVYILEGQTSIPNSFIKQFHDANIPTKVSNSNIWVLRTIYLLSQQHQLEVWDTEKYSVELDLVILFTKHSSDTRIIYLTLIKEQVRH